MNNDLNQLRAERLHRDHRQRKSFQPFVGDLAIEAIDDAYTTQQFFVEKLLAESEDRIGGYKIGLTSPRMQALLGIDSPIGGQVFAKRLFASGHRARLSDHLNLGIECEIAVRLTRDLEPGAAPFTDSDIASAVDAVCPAFELVDDRAADYSQTDIGSLIADNSWNAGIVLGEFTSEWPELEQVVGVVSRNGVELDRGRGADVLGHPFAPLQWLANHLAARGVAMRAGEIIATGSMIPTRCPEQAEHCTFAVDGLGEVSVHIEP